LLFHFSFSQLAAVGLTGQMDGHGERQELLPMPGHALWSSWMTRQRVGRESIPRALEMFICLCTDLIADLLME
jgi:hypothetical protein